MGDDFDMREHHSSQQPPPTSNGSATTTGQGSGAGGEEADQHMTSSKKGLFPVVMLRCCAAAVIFSLGLVLADLLVDAEVTAPGLATVGATVLALWVLLPLWRKPAHPVGVGTAAGFVAERGGSATVQRRPAESLARHEAAHAVVAHALGHRVTHVTIAATGQTGGSTGVEYATGGRVTVDRIAITYAGPWAEGTGDVVYQIPGDFYDDYTALMRLALAASINDRYQRTPNELFDAGVHLARAIVADNTEAIEAVAAALVSTERQRDLDEAETTALMQKHQVSLRTTEMPEPAADGAATVGDHTHRSLDPYGSSAIELSESPEFLYSQDFLAMFESENRGHLAALRYFRDVMEKAWSGIGCDWEQHRAPDDDRVGDILLTGREDDPLLCPDGPVGCTRLEFYDSDDNGPDQPPTFTHYTFAADELLSPAGVRLLGLALTAGAGNAFTVPNDLERTMP